MHRQLACVYEARVSWMAGWLRGLGQSSSVPTTASKPRMMKRGSVKPSMAAAVRSAAQQLMYNRSIPCIVQVGQ